MQWDNWALLQAVADPDIVTLEASDVVTAIHLDHGAAKASHTKEGSQHNQQLAVYLPHKWVKEIKIYHPGTIWLGRLDETDFVLTSKVNLHARRTPSYYENKTAPVSGTCPLCFAVRNYQSLDLLLYARHDLSRNRRCVLMVRVSQHQLNQAADYFCTATSRGVNNILFIADTERVAVALKTWGLPAYHDADAGSGPLLAYLEVIKQAISKAYHVFVGTLDHVPVRSLRILTDSAGGDKNDKDIILMDDFAQVHAFFFVCSRGRTSAMWVELISNVEKTLGATAAVAPGSWRESVVLQTAWAQSIKSITGAAAGSYKPSIGYFRQAHVARASAIFSAMDQAKLPIERSVTGQKRLDVAVGADGRTPIPLSATVSQLQGTRLNLRAFHDTVGRASHSQWDTGNLFWGPLGNKAHRCTGVSTGAMSSQTPKQPQGAVVGAALAGAVLVRMD